MISVTEAIEELLYTKGGPSVAHRHKIAELLLAQETKILELTEGEKEEKDTEPPRPKKCSNCDATYDICNRMLSKSGGTPCCDVCQDTATHKQDAWEKWRYKQNA